MDGGPWQEGVQSQLGIENSPGASERASLPGHGRDRPAVLTPERHWALPGSILAQTIKHSSDPKVTYATCIRALPLSWELGMSSGGQRLQTFSSRGKKASEECSMAEQRKQG